MRSPAASTLHADEAGLQTATLTSHIRIQNVFDFRNIHRRTAQAYGTPQPLPGQPNQIIRVPDQRNCQFSFRAAMPNRAKVVT